MLWEFLVAHYSPSPRFFRSTILLGQIPSRLRERPPTHLILSQFLYRSPFSAKLAVGAIFMGGMASDFSSSLCPEMQALVLRSSTMASR